MNKAIKNNEKKPIPRIAIVAVHGVGSHTPGGTVRAVADLLPRFYPSDYEPSLQSNLRIKVEKVELTQQVPSVSPTSRYNQRGSKMLARQQPDQPASEDTLPFEYMADQLQGLELSEKDRIYESIRLETALTEGASIPKAKLHFHELHWSDISHTGPGFLRGIIELYSLLFDLCSLGRHSLDAALTRHPSNKVWQIFRHLQAFAEWCLVQGVPITNLGAVVVATAFLILAVPVSLLPWICAGLPAVFLGGGTAFYLSIRAGTTHPKRWLVNLPVALAMTAAGWLLGNFILDHVFHSPTRMAAVVWWPIPLGGFLWLMRLYDERRPGAFITSLVVAIGTTILFVWQICTVHLPQPTDAGHLLDAVLRTIEGIFLVMTPAWLGLWLSLFLMTLVGIVAVWRSKVYGPEEHLKMSRAAWTANLTIFLPALMVVVCNVSLWSAISAVSRDSIATYQTSYHRPLYADISEKSARNIFQAVSIEADEKTGYLRADLAAKLLARDGGKFMPRGVAILVVSLLIAVWVLSPAVWNERWPTPNSPQSAEWLGRTLTEAFVLLRGAGEWIRWAVIGTTLFTVSNTWLWQRSLLNFRPFAFEEHWILRSEAVLAAIVVALVASRGPFKFLVLGFRGVLDVAIDVVNWLRVHPLKANPRARISARFASLLRYISDERQGYEALIIVAHSQGTVISADLLRFLKHQNDKGNAQFASLFDGHLPIYLFTMGSPLRQLYSLRFPHLYGWARGEIVGAQSAEKIAPLADDLGVVRWINAFRSGDYVGRCLWHSEDDPTSWTINREPVPPTCNHKEFCIGTGAHTHYWDDSASIVADELHCLIAEVMASSGPQE